MDFPCTKCGACCRFAGVIHSELSRGNGFPSCKYLKDNECTIYDTRPDYCRLDYELHRNGSAKDCNSEMEYFETRKEGCDFLQKMLHIDPKYTVKLDKEE